MKYIIVSFYDTILVKNFFMKEIIMIHVVQARAALIAAASVSPERVSRFFKTGSGDYSEGDRFIGVTVPDVRKIAREFHALSCDDLHELLLSKSNEERLLALFIVVLQFQRSDELGKKKVYDFYMHHLQHVNNWNLVDSSAHVIVGAYLYNKDKQILFTLAESKDLWERRVAIVATWFFIRQGQVETTFELAAVLLDDGHDLIHKAVGWMLREAGKRDVRRLIEFLEKHAAHMPRTMLRYSIEKFPEAERKNYLKRKAV